MTGASKKIVIVGGGIGGLAAALSLLKRGLDVEVYEQAPELKEVGAGIQISSNGTRVLYALGLEDALKRVQVLPSRRVIRHWSTGETWNWFDLGATTAQRYGTPPGIVGKLNAAINETLRSPEMKDSMAKLGFDAKIGSPQDFATFIAEEIPRWAEIVKATGVMFE